jgi:hypothetical protein
MVAKKPPSGGAVEALYIDFGKIAQGVVEESFRAMGWV